MLTLLPQEAGACAFSTLAGFNICTYAGFRGSVEADLQRLEQLTGLPRHCIYLPVQTHSARVALAGSDSLIGADAVVARGPGCAVGIHTADCLPLLLVDPVAQVIAAVHCGWRGTVAGIVPNALAACLNLGADPRRIIAAIGPHICPRCFEVGEEVAAQFPPEAVVRRPGRPRPHVDLAAAVCLPLRAAGITRIHHCHCCSKENQNFYSVRRQGPALTLRTLTLLHLP